MLDIGWAELLLIGIVALIVVGPKELPGLFRTVGQFTGRARGMAREFQRSLEQAADQTGVNDAAKSFKDATKFDLGDGAKTALRPSPSPKSDTARAPKPDPAAPAPEAPAPAAAETGETPSGSTAGSTPASS